MSFTENVSRGSLTDEENPVKAKSSSDKRPRKYILTFSITIAFWLNLS